MKIRCSMSRMGLNTFGKNRRGYIVGESRNGKCWIILWDYLKQKQKIHKSFIYIDCKKKF